jgi:ribonuclease HII
LTDRLVLERALWSRGVDRVAGVDEAGRGALFGPVVAGAVILDARKNLEDYRDSKTLTAQRREALFRRILGDGHAWSLGVVSPQEIDSTDIRKATLRAMSLAVSALPVAPSRVLVDGNAVPALSCPAEAVIDGDELCATIAAASIVAKVVRDRLIRALEGFFPGYGLGEHKGYGTRAHLEALARLGPTPMHRRSFRGVPREMA